MQINSHSLSQERLMAHLDGELSAKEAAIVAAHLQHCRECQELAADLQSVSSHLSAWQIEEPNFELIELPQAASKAPQSAQRKSFTWLNPSSKHYSTFGFAGFSIVVITIVSALFLRHSPPLRRSSENPVYLPDYKSQPKGEQTTASDRFSPGVVGGVLGEVTAPNAAPVPPPPPPSQTAAPSGPLIIRTAQLSLTTNDFPHIRESIDRVLSSHTGYIAQLEMNTPADEARSLEASLRIPAAQLDAALGDLKRLGHVDSESQRGEEVTQRVVDIGARLGNLRMTEARLTDILRQRTGKLADVLAVEEQIDSVRGQIESMEAEQKSLNKQIAFATVQLRVKEEYKRPLALNNDSLLTRLRNAAVEGFQTLGNGLIGVLLLFLSYGPTLLILSAVLFYPVRSLWRRLQRTI